MFGSRERAARRSPNDHRNPPIRAETGATARTARPGPSRGDPARRDRGRKPVRRRADDRRAVARPLAGGDRLRGRLRHPRRHDPPRLRPAVGLHEGPARPRPPRAGRRARGHGLRAGHRQGRGLHGDVRPGGDQPRHPDRRRPHGLDPGRGDHRSAVPGADRHRRVPGSRHHRHHHADHQAQHAGHRRPGDPAGDRGGLPPRVHGPTRPGAGGHPQGRPAGADDVQLAPGAAAARLPADDPAARQADPRGRQAHHRRAQARALRRRRRAQGRGVGGAARLAEQTGIPVVTTLMARGRVPRQPPPARGHARHARHGGRGGGDAEVRPARGARRALRRPRHRPARQLRPERQDRARGHRPGGDLQEPAGRRPDRGRLPRGDPGADRRGRGGAGRAPRGGSQPRGGRT